MQKNAKILYEPVHEKTNNLGFQPGPTQTMLYSYRRWLEAGNFGFREKRKCAICVAKTRALISFAVTAKLICAFVFAYADCWFFHAVAHMQLVFLADCYSIHIHNDDFGQHSIGELQELVFRQYGTRPEQF